MDRSTVRETYMRGSFVFNNTGNVNRSFISTALVNDSLAYNDDLRKSRIQNLPSYKKINLGEHKEFIIVFQTIEIQRLSGQVEVLRMKVIQTNRQLFNNQSYQEQIRQLTEKCFQMEKLREQYTEQIDKLGKICETLYHENQTLKNRLSQMDFSLKQKFQSQKQRNVELQMENQKWRNRYQAMQKSKEKQLQDLKMLMQMQRKSMIDRQIKQITISFQNQRLHLENQIRKHRELLENSNRQLNDYKQRCQKYQITLVELKNYENIINDNENKIVLLNQQLMRLRDQYSKKDLQLQDFKQRQYMLNQQLKGQQDWENQSRQLKATLENRNKQIQQWKVRTSRLQSQVGKGREMVHYNQELTNKLVLGTKEIERVNKNYKNKMQECDDLRAKLGNRDAEISKLRNLQNQNEQFETKLLTMQAQRDRTDGLLKSRLEEIEQWKSRYAKSQANINSLMNVEREKKMLQDKLNSQIRNGEQLQGIIKKMEKEFIVYRGYETQMKEYQRQIGAMGKQIQRLGNLAKNSSIQIEDYRTRIAKNQKALSDFRNAEVQIKDLNHRINMMTQQKERFNTIIRERNEALGALEKQKIEFVSKLNALKNNELKIAQNQQYLVRMREDIAKARRDTESWQARAKQFESKARQLQNNLYQNNSQKQKLSAMIKNKNNEYDELRSRYSRLEGDNRKIIELQNQVKEYHNQTNQCYSDLETLERNLKQRIGQLEREKAVTNQFAYKIIVLSCQIERLSGNGQTKGGINSREYQQLQQDYSRLQSKVTSKNNEIDILHNRIGSLEQKVSQLTRQFTRLLQEAQRNEQETLLLVKRIEQYQEYAKKIHILGAEIDRLQVLNKSLDEDARNIRLKFADGIAYQKRQQDHNLLTVLLGVQIQQLRIRAEKKQLSMDEMRTSYMATVRQT